MESEGVAAVICNTCVMFLILPKHRDNYTCKKSKRVALLEKKVQCLDDPISILQQIKDFELYLDRAEHNLLDKEDTGHT